MATKYVITVEASDSDNPIKADNKRENLQRTAAILNAVASGHKPVNYTVDVRHSAVKASGTVTCAGVAGADTVTINGQALTATQQYARGTITCVAVAVDDTVTIQGQVFTAKTAENTAAGEFNRSGVDDAATATSLLACINANATVSALVTGATASNVVTIRSIVAGTAGNAYTLVSSDGATLAVSGAGTMTGGAAIANNQFDFGGTDTQTAASLVACVNASTTSIVSDHVVASNAAGVVTLTALVPGVSGNAITLASSNGTRLAVSAARLASGAETLVEMDF